MRHQAMDNNVKDKLQTAGGIAAGVGTYRVSRAVIAKGSKKLLAPLDKPLNPQEIDTFKKVGEQIFQENFKSKGIEIFDVSKQDYEKFFQERYNHACSSYDKILENTKNPIRKLIIKNRKNSFLKNAKKLDSQTLAGKNAYYLQRAIPVVQDGKKQFKLSKTIVINMNKTPIYLPHELGHAQNFMNKSLSTAMHRVWKNPVFQRRALFAILGTALLTNKKSEDKQKEPKNPLYPVGLFIKNNCGKLMTLALLPAVWEEGLASLNGQMMAKKLLKGKDLNTLTKSHIRSFAGYSLWAAGAGTAVYLANKVRDKIVEYKKSPNNENC